MCGRFKKRSGSGFDQQFCRELTKLHQEFLRGTAPELADRISEPRGEFTVIVGQALKQQDNKDIHLTDAEVADEFWRITNSGDCSRRAVIKQLAKKSGRSAKDVYSVIERTKDVGRIT